MSWWALLKLSVPVLEELAKVVKPPYQRWVLMALALLKAISDNPDVPTPEILAAAQAHTLAQTQGQGGGA